MNFGFVIDNRRCIGCHACSTACKSENDVPVGVYRTWVKTVETGTFPNTQRHFQVTRCNHCSNPPCVRICPTSAMFQRPDGIVEFDKDHCIGCKACLQACPYDAIHIDPESGTAAKCHYCAHRTDLGLEPACVVVCPTHAILSGDMDDPETEIAQVLAREKVSVRKPEQGTAPNLFYIDGTAVSLHPTATSGAPATFNFTDPVGGEPAPEPPPPPAGRAQAQGLPHGGPISIGGRHAAQLVQVTYNAQHEVPWHWPVPAYLVTKGIGAGAFAVYAAGFFLGLPWHTETALLAGFLALLFTAITTGLLVVDLERPERFLKILLRPQWRSWLTRGAVILIAFSAVAGAWWMAELAASRGWVGEPGAGLRALALGLGGVLAVGAAVYTAFLFGQAEGRDLWQSPLVPVHLLVQAAILGSAALLLAPGSLPEAWDGFARSVLVGSLIVDLLLLFLGELGMPHATDVAARAAHAIRAGKYRMHFWLGAIVLGHAVPLVLLLASGSSPTLGIACLAAIGGMYLYEYAWVMAPQEVPNS